MCYLAPRNEIVNDLNEELLTTMMGDVFTLYNADKVVEDDDAEIYATEYLNTVDIPNLPPQKLKLKIRAPVILLHNLTPSICLCNGTCFEVTHITQRVVECEILGGKYADNMLFISHIPLSPFSTADLPLYFRR